MRKPHFLFWLAWVISSPVWAIESQVPTLPQLRLKFSWEMPLDRSPASERRFSLAPFKDFPSFHKDFKVAGLRFEPVTSPVYSRYRLLPQSFTGSLSWYP